MYVGEDSQDLDSLDNAKTSDETAQSLQALIVEEKAAAPTDTTWCALDDYKQPVKPATPAVSDQLPQLSEEQKEATVVAWDTFKLSEVDDEGEEVAETTPAPVIEQANEPRATLSLSGESSWNAIATKDEPAAEAPSWSPIYCYKRRCCSFTTSTIIYTSHF